MKRKVTLRDVACEAGVSVGTVSHYLNNPESVRRENRRKIEAVIHRLDFVPNVSARSLAVGRSNNVVLYILSERIISPTTWLHQLPMIQTIHSLLSRAGYSLQIVIVYEDDADDFMNRVRGSVEGKAADGILILSVWEPPERISDYLVKARFPFVALDSEGERPEVQYVCFDNRRLMSEIVDMVYRRGHRKIAYMGVRSQQQDMNMRFQGYLDGMCRNGLPIEDANILYGDFSIESGRRCVEESLSTGGEYTALLCGNDNMAVGALKAIEARKLNVPGDISLIGIDNSVAAKACARRLNTVEFDLAEMARIGVERLLSKMNGKETAGVVRLGYRLIQGETLR